MRYTVNLSESELEEAVKQYVQRQGMKPIGKVSFSREGYPDSPDPREQALSFSASVTAESAAKAAPARMKG